MKKLGLIIVVGLGMILAGCSIGPLNAFSGDAKTHNVNIEKDEAKELDVQLELGAGEMYVTGGSEEWATGEFTYTKNKFKPNVDYDLDNETGKLSIKQKDNISVDVNFGKQKNNWDLQLTDDIPINLEVEAGASDTELDLSGIQLTSLSVEAGVGDVKVNLSGDWNTSFNATLETGVGETTVILPKDVGVKVVSTEGIGTSSFKGFISQGNDVYVNEAYDTADVIINIEAEMGVGEAKFKLE